MDSEDLFQMTPLRKVSDWAWDKYRVHYWRDEDHCNSKENPVATRFCIESDNGIWNYISEHSFPVDSNYVSWEPLHQNVKSKLQFVKHPRYGGTQVLGTGWCEE